MKIFKECYELYANVLKFIKSIGKKDYANWFYKSDSHLPKNDCFICVNESLLKMMKNVSYYILKGIFVLKIFKFLS